jgi:hypothetical protein
MSYVYISLVKLDIHNFGEAYIVHGARKVQLASLALGSETCNVTGKVGDRTLSSEQWRGEGSRAGHVKLAAAATTC